MILAPVTRLHCQVAREWRNGCRETLRTPILLTVDQQNSFYDGLQDRNSANRYWEIKEGETFLGLGGLAGIEWENRLAEISLIIDPARQGQGYGKKAVRLLLEEGFLRMNLKTIVGVAYLCNPKWYFWSGVVKEYDAFGTTLPNVKYWNGEYHNGFYFSIDRKCLET
jgi:RimJ/RimL family protein N-acetyltransferase